MKLRTQITVFGLVGTCLTVVVGGMGLMSARRMETTVQSTAVASSAMQAKEALSRMHIAIRSDGQLALFGAQQKSPERIAEAEKNLKAHIDTLNQALAQLKGLAVDETTQTALGTLAPLLAQYIDMATLTVDSTKIDIGMAENKLGGLQNTYGEIEQPLTDLAKLIESNAQVVAQDAQQGVRQTTVAIGLAVALAALTMTLAALLLAQRMTRPMAHAVSVAAQLADGDLTTTILPSGNDETVQMLESMQRMLGSFQTIVRNVKHNAQAVENASTEIAQGNNDLSDRTEQQASALQETTSSVETLSEAVQHNADAAQQANQMAMSASSVAHQGGTVVGHVVETMRGINESSRKIADITSVIDGIAFQTNILALNAAVEAARAGEQGRGFAVVASEVRSLASRSAEAAKEIKHLITTSVERVEQGTRQVDQAGATMAEVVEAIRRVTGIMQEISTASSSQSAVVAQVRDALSQLDRVTQQNAALVEEIAASAVGLRNQAGEMVLATSAFRLDEAAPAPTSSPALLESTAKTQPVLA